MLFHKRHSFFPLILALLTLGLILLMFYAFTGKQPASTSVSQEVTPISSQEYQKEFTTLITSFVEQYPQKEDDLSRLVLVEQTLSFLLSLRVPTEAKEQHLNMAVELNQMQQALREKSGKEKEAFERIAPYVQN
jgi:hypothetical protein